MSEPLIRLLAELPAAEPDPARAERIRVRCRARLVRQALRPSALRGPAPRGRTAQLWQPLVVVLGAAYLAEVSVTVTGRVESAGEITSNVGTARQMQVGLKIEF
jgi:hypothetical protein